LCFGRPRLLIKFPRKQCINAYHSYSINFWKSRIFQRSFLLNIYLLRINSALIKFRQSFFSLVLLIRSFNLDHNKSKTREFFLSQNTKNTKHFHFLFLRASESYEASFYFQIYQRSTIMKNTFDAPFSIS